MKNNINLISIIKEIIKEQNTPQTYPHTRETPLKIPKDPYVYAYEEPNTIWVKNTKTNIGWINITKGVQDGKDKYKKYENHIITNFGSTLGIPTNNQNLKIQKKTTTNNQSFTNNLSNNFSLINPDMLPSVKPNINPTFSYCYNTKLDPNKSNILNKKYNKSQCAAFVNDFSIDIGPFGSAWLGHDNDELGIRVWSAFEKLPPEKIKDVINLFISINKRGGAIENGPDNIKIMNLVNSIVPETCPIELMLGDVIGIFYPGSKHYEEAFMQAGYKYFFDKNGEKIKIDGKTFKPPPGVLHTDIKPGNSITNGKGWGMNTHVGIVGDIQDNIPYIFHNIGIDDVKNIGIIYADPPNHLKGNGRIAWVKRNKIDANIKPTQVTNQPMNIQPIPQLNLTAKLQNNQPK